LKVFLLIISLIYGFPVRNGRLLKLIYVLDKLALNSAFWIPIDCYQGGGTQISLRGRS